MKKNVSNIALMGVIVILSGYIMYLRRASEDQIIVTPPSQPMSQLEYVLIKNMVDTYEARQLMAHDSVLNLNDARSVWHDLESLEAFIYHMKLNAKKNSIGVEDLGIRFYYAAYPSTASWGNYPNLAGVPKNYEYRHTLVMIPTIKRGSVNEDFNPLELGTYTQGLKTFYEGANVNKSLFSLTTTPLRTPTGAYNHGSLIPPGGMQGVAFD